LRVHRADTDPNATRPAPRPPLCGRALRPSRPADVAVAAPEADPPPPDSRAAAVDDAVAAALAAAVVDTSFDTAPGGPPLTSGERDDLRVAVARCWSLGAASSDVMRTTVIVGVSLSRDGRPEAGTIRLISHDGGSAASADLAFQAARRAILRCGAEGYDLPAEKFAQWRNIEMTFNPEKMRLR
jgi:hypothetical protein